MVRFAAHRLGILVLSLVGASVLVFGALTLLPGSPAQVILGTQATPQSVHHLTVQLGLDKPLWQQYFDWLHGMVTGALGTSYVSQLPIGTQIWQALQVTGPLVLLGLVIGLVIAIPLGLFGALLQGRATGAVLGAIGQVGLAVPTFVGGTLLIIVFAVEFHVLPASGFPEWSHPGSALKSLLLPAISLGVVEGGIISRYLRTSVLDLLQSDYLRTARMKGLSMGQALRRHGLRNAMLPLVTVGGLELAGLIVGAIVVENVFTLPGIGTLLLTSVNNRDLLVAQDIVMFVSGTVLVLNLLVDLSYRLLDPRLAGRS
ncbi:ABC transporter permease [Acidiferrimicrobium sp. IK]|uniref:ABC transporter permease n=1 Tax=Acidiferrimicrobium sp. IK TaxID=2871700 RepID=UPI0021CAE3FB|nr:ABC transporter permease [Acidiferrimicrobium sp. IK]MCU4184950.1 ABC transporter permease [Acidiferrimicrobium sp. IK]